MGSLPDALNRPGDPSSHLYFGGEWPGDRGVYAGDTLPCLGRGRVGSDHGRVGSHEQTEDTDRPSKQPAFRHGRPGEMP